jgi:holo-[acyl-carrier protein] synthase
MDLVKIEDVTRSIERFGDRYLGRVYTDEEVGYATAEPGRRAERLAARFAAKEATRKVLAQGADGVGFRSIEVQRSAHGGCEIVLHREAAAAAQQQGIFALSLSMTHEAEYAAAVVVAELGRRPRRSRLSTASRAGGVR